MSACPITHGHSIHHNRFWSPCQEHSEDAAGLDELCNTALAICMCSCGHGSWRSTRLPCSLPGSQLLLQKVHMLWDSGSLYPDSRQPPAQSPVRPTQGPGQCQELLQVLLGASPVDRGDSAVPGADADGRQRLARWRRRRLGPLERARVRAQAPHHRRTMHPPPSTTDVMCPALAVTVGSAGQALPCLTNMP